MFFVNYKTDRFYNGEQNLFIMVRDNRAYDDRFLAHDITFQDKSRGIVGCFNFVDVEDRDFVLEYFTTPEQIGRYVLGAYDRGEYQIGNETHTDQMCYYVARYEIMKGSE